MAAYEKGDRVRLVYCSDPYTRLAPGTLGRVTFTDDLGTVHIKWDNGAGLGMVEAAGDRFELVETLAAQELRECREYHALSDEERARYDELGEVGGTHAECMAAASKRPE